MREKSFQLHLKSEIKRHWIDYGTLALASFLTIFLVWKYQGSSDVQFSVFIVFAIYYVIWGVVHHIRDNSWTIKVILEYFLISSILLLLAHVLL